MKTVLISGCSSGFGAACAIAFGESGYRVIATMRDIGKSDFLKKYVEDKSIVLDTRKLDVTDQSSISECVSSIERDYGNIDILINNAGIHLLGTIEDMDRKKSEKVFATNFWGALNLTRAVLPLMRKRRQGRIISISSVGSRVGRAGDGIYCASKAALEMAFEAMSFEVKRFGIHVSVICPGAYKTEIQQNFSLEEPYSSISPYRDLIAFRTEKVIESCKRGGDPSDVSRSIVAVAEEIQPQFRYVLGEHAIGLNHEFSHLEGEDRRDFLIKMSGIDWWVTGKSPPPKS